MVLIITLFVAPFLSMRLFAEEKRNKTFELLMTTPVRPMELVLGKYLGGLGIISATLGLTIVFPLMLSAFGASESGAALEWPTVLLGYGARAAVGRHLHGGGDVHLRAHREPDGRRAAHLRGAAAVDAAARRWRRAPRSRCARSSPTCPSTRSCRTCIKGVLDLKALVFFLSVILFSLLLTHRAVEAQRWA